MVKNTTIKVPPGSKITIDEQASEDQKDLASSKSNATHNIGKSASIEKETTSKSTIHEKASSNTKTSMKTASEKSNEVIKKESDQGRDDNRDIKVKVKHEFKYK